MMGRKEFENSLKQPIDFWSAKNREDVQSLLGYDVANMVGYDQRNPHHCYNLLLHTLKTVEYISSNAQTGIELCVAAFFHDIGKPRVAQEKKGRLVFYNHAKKSAEIAKPLLGAMRYSNSEIDRICFFIVHHDDFISWKKPTESYNRNNSYLIPITKENANSYVRKTIESGELPLEVYSKDLWRELLLLCRADALAQAEYVFVDGVFLDSREQKIERIDYLSSFLEGIL